MAVIARCSWPPETVGMPEPDRLGLGQAERR
jgi:hypothetical protein